MNQMQILKNMFTQLSLPKEHNGLTRKAEEFFNTQAHFNKWLKELTIDEAAHLRDMLVMFHEEQNVQGSDTTEADSSNTVK